MVLMFALLIGLLLGLNVLARRGVSLSRRVLIAVALGAFLGLASKAYFADETESLTTFLSWSDVVASGYVSLLKMIVMPLVLVSMIAAVIKLEAVAALGRIGGLVVLILMGTTLVAALIGAMVAALSGLDLSGLVEGERELARAEALERRSEQVSDLSLPSILVSFLPTNIFADLSGTRPTSIIAVAIFGMLVGTAGLYVRTQSNDLGERILKGIEAIQALVMALVRLVIHLTPYGVLALMLHVSASANASDIFNLLGFILASYAAILLMFLVHGLILRVAGLSPSHFFSQAWPALSFAFASRSSAATIPINVEVQIRGLRNPPPIANLSATFGATIGQNGCAGIYPAMLAVMIAPSLGLDPMAADFLLPLLLIVTISSFGIAGVGGGATFAALVVLPAMGLPVTLVALLISIEPLIDMARTALNVSGSMIAGTLTQRILKMPTPSIDSNTEKRNDNFI